MARARLLWERTRRPGLYVRGNYVSTLVYLLHESSGCCSPRHRMPIASRIFPISHLLGAMYLFLLFIFLLLGPVLRAVPSGPDNVSMRIHVRRYAPAVRVPSFPTITMNYHKSPLHVERCGCSFVKQPRVKSIRVPLSRSMLLNRYHFSAISREWADRSAILIQKMNWFTSNVVRVLRRLREHCRFRVIRSSSAWTTRWNM